MQQLPPFPDDAPGFEPGAPEPSVPGQPAPPAQPSEPGQPAPPAQPSEPGQPTPAPQEAPPSYAPIDVPSPSAHGTETPTTPISPIG